MIKVFLDNIFHLHLDGQEQYDLLSTCPYFFVFFPNKVIRELSIGQFKGLCKQVCLVLSEELSQHSLSLAHIIQDVV